MARRHLNEADKAKARELYFQDRLSIVGIAAQIGFSDTTVRMYLRTLPGYVPRPGKPSFSNATARPAHGSKAQLAQLDGLNSMMADWARRAILTPCEGLAA